MDELIRDRDLGLRLMRDDAGDYARMAGWLTDDRVLEFYEGRDNPFPLARVIEEYSPRVLYTQAVTPCFLVWNDAPIGYLQYYPVVSVGAQDVAQSIYGADQFIGEPGCWNRGLGTRAVSLLLSYLFSAKAAQAVVVDPHVDNLRAIRCYEKCGFKKIRILPRHELHEGVQKDSWLMEIRYSEFCILNPDSRLSTPAPDS